MILLQLVQKISKFLGDEVGDGSPADVVNTNFYVVIDQDGDLMSGKVTDITIKNQHGKHVLYLNIPRS